MSRSRALLAAAFALAVPASTASCDSNPVKVTHAQDITPIPVPGDITPISPNWHAGAFRHLRKGPAEDITTFVPGLAHPRQQEGIPYAPLDATRRGHFNTFVTALFAAIEASLVNPESGNWCGVVAAASRAGYNVRRFYDTGIDPATGLARNRWYVYGYDRTTAGQAYFFINPNAKRDIVIEIPHAHFDFYYAREGKKQGVNLFVGLAARALLVSGAHRCNSPVQSECEGASSACNGYPGDVPNRYRESDVAHDTRTTFHLLHTRYSSQSAQTKFVQSHGMDTTYPDLLQAADGLDDFNRPASISVDFVNALRGRLADTPYADHAYVYSCQQLPPEVPQADGSRRRLLWASNNIQGRTTNLGSSSFTSCQSEVTSITGPGRFLHIEQEAEFLDADAVNRWVEGAIRDVWGACNMTGNPSDCALGPRQSNPTTRICPVQPPP